MSELRFRRLHPEPGELGVEEATAGLAGRELLAVNMVASADGRATLEGRTAALSDPADRDLFHALRARADAVMVGVGTLRAERYGRFTKNERWRELRAGEGLAEEPLGVTISRSLELPYEIPLFQDPAARLVVFTSSDRDVEPCPASLEVVRTDDLRPESLLAHLRAEHGVRSILCEGGPTLNGVLFGAGVVDELFLTVSPVLAGGPAPLTILEGALPEPVSLELVQALAHGSGLLLRYALRASG